MFENFTITNQNIILQYLLYIHSFIRVPDLFLPGAYLDEVLLLRVKFNTAHVSRDFPKQLRRIFQLVKIMRIWIARCQIMHCSTSQYVSKVSWLGFSWKKKFCRQPVLMNFHASVNFARSVRSRSAPLISIGRDTYDMNIHIVLSLLGSFWHIRKYPGLYWPDPPPHRLGPPTPTHPTHTPSERLT